MIRLAALALAVLAAAPAAAAPARPRGLVLIAIDDLRADRVGPLTPALDAFFSSGTAFAQAVSQAPWSLPSYLSVMTSEDPSRHGVTNKYADLSVDPPVMARLKDSSPASVTLAEVLRAKGFRTAAFTGGAALDRVSGLAEGFEVYDDSVAFAGFERSVPEALAWLKTLKPDERFFLFVHGYDVHPFHPGRFTPAQDARHRARRQAQLEGKADAPAEDEKADSPRLYDAAVRAMDARLAPLLAALDAPELRGRVVVGAFSDHGEELFDHGGVDHGLTLDEEMIRVALLLRGPGVPARRASAQVRLVDLLPTALDLLGVAETPAVCAQRDGVSLRPLLEGKPLALDAFSETDFLLAASLRSLRSADGWKLIRDQRARRSRLYDLNADPGQRDDRSASDGERLDALEDRLLTEFDGEPPARGKAVCDGAWKLVRTAEGPRLFDLRSDPLQKRDLSAARRDVVRRLSAR